MTVLPEQEKRNDHRIEDRLALSLVVHELTAPLTAVLQLIYGLKAGIDGRLSRKSLETVDRIRVRLEEALSLVELRTDVFRVWSGGALRDPRPIDVGAVLDSAVEILRPLADSRKVGLVFRNRVGSVPVFGCSDLLEMCFADLVYNAVIHNRQWTEVDVLLEADKAKVRIFIRDTGTGMDPGRLSSLLGLGPEPDSTGDGRRGLGLALARRIVEAHSGSISGDTEPKRGTVLTVCLPRLVSEETDDHS